jgi:hypothetical protein
MIAKKTVADKSGGVSTCTKWYIKIPPLEDCRRHFACLVPGVDLLWKPNLTTQHRLPLHESLENFLNPFPRYFFGYNVQKMIENGNFVQAIKERVSGEFEEKEPTEIAEENSADFKKKFQNLFNA